MRAGTTGNAIEQLAMRLFQRDHPHRGWRVSGPGAFAAGKAGFASAEERRLYCAFARGRLDEERRPQLQFAT